MSPDAGSRARALRFVLLFGAASLFADFTYEGSRSIVGPYLGLLGAGAFVVATVTGLGELLGYGLRLGSGGLADRTRWYWPITLLGYGVQMAAVPCLALVRSWPAAAALVLAERIGKATRNPPRDVMLAHAGSLLGYGWAFGVHEALDQAGALAGPLVVALVLALHHAERAAFALLALPAVLTLAIVVTARLTHPRPADLEPHASGGEGGGSFSPAFWTYLAGAALVAAGFADFPFMAYHLTSRHVVAAVWIPVLYALAMGTSAVASLVFGRLFDRRGLTILVPLTALGALFAPLVFLGNTPAVVAGVVLWGLGMGVHESIVPAAVALMVPGGRRASAYGMFTAAYGTAWFAGSAAMGALYGASVQLVVAFAVVSELVAVPAIVRAAEGARERPDPIRPS